MPKNANLSRAKVKQWLAKYPRSPWWIHNARLADFCGIQHEGDLHNTAILGKYMPRGQVFWERSPGLNSKLLKIMIVDCLDWSRVFCGFVLQLLGFMYFDCAYFFIV